ncbi:hypothetical protein DB30_02777 [Enhygromyxa salina]|uniref:Tetratricopeptide repeat protein n=1 Tax=Enhygromyxa salina TaxID=215803 RepID=A0A0C1ZJV9_9BACT|nr:hypothetical protein [Enhygromyxa salina]KIG17744.1 hypothetical protein DB30_02777 [Enhygromyxa salina]
MTPPDTNKPASALVPTRAATQLATVELPALPNQAARQLRTLALSGGLVSLVLVTYVIAFSIGIPLLVYVIGIGGVLLAIKERRRVEHGNRIYEAAREDMRSGDIAAATQAVDEVLLHSGTSLRYAAVYVRLALLRGVLALRRGQLQEARARLLAVEATGWLGSFRISRQATGEAYASLSICGSVLGEVDDARAWLERGREVLDPSREHAITPHKDDELDSSSLSIELAEATLLAREDQHQQLFALLQRLGHDKDNLLGRALQLLQAYTLHRLSEGEDEYRGVFSSMPIEPLLANLRPGELDFMAVHWPELHAFMQARRLLARD